MVSSGEYHHKLPKYHITGLLGKRQRYDPGRLSSEHKYGLIGTGTKGVACRLK